ncbi:MAG: hypothetical protein IPH72_26615 [Sandaracinaceae bacterium]|nr:hypothetical protein [Sandaracinaceae bacterium]
MGDGNLDLCSCLITADCSSTACAAGTRCEDDGCGGQRCVTVGHPCVDATDCPNGGTCVDSPAGRSCRSPGPNCRDDRECPLGFACEGMDCVDRRIACDNQGTTFDCPIGYVCDFLQRQGQAFCRRMDIACTHDAMCPQPAACFDLDGDGARECPGGTHACPVHRVFPEVGSAAPRPTPGATPVGRTAAAPSSHAPTS